MDALEKQQELDENYTFADWLLQGEQKDKVEYQTFDGWYNNPWHLSLGSTGPKYCFITPLINSDPLSFPYSFCC
ncbi:unnamed protein product [Larinioides sclopetarius]|uniref:Uncharacterized protein n=1 Tax=Larinioides sclopetarius TaxID=280406 RepID=A0AAV2BQ88_9ARAC